MKEGVAWLFQRSVILLMMPVNGHFRNGTGVRAGPRVFYFLCLVATPASWSKGRERGTAGAAPDRKSHTLKFWGKFFCAVGGLRVDAVLVSWALALSIVECILCALSII